MDQHKDGVRELTAERRCDGIEPAAGHDVRAVRAFAEHEHAKAQVGQHEPEAERDEPERQRRRGQAAQTQSGTEHIAAGDDGEKAEHPAGVAEVRPQRGPELKNPHQGDQRQPGERHDIDGEQQCGKCDQFLFAHWRTNERRPA